MQVDQKVVLDIMEPFLLVLNDLVGRVMMEINKEKMDGARSLMVRLIDVQRRDWCLEEVAPCM